MMRRYALRVLLTMSVLLGILSSAQAASYTFTQLDIPTIDPRDINDHGQIVGADETEGFLYDAGVFTTIAVPGAAGTQAFGINNRGEVVGEYLDSGGNVHGFLYDDGVFTPLDVPFPGAHNTEAFKINDHSQVVGFYNRNNLHGFLYDAGVFTPVDAPGAFFTEAFSINNRGQIIGTSGDSKGIHSFLATPTKRVKN